MSVKQLHEQLSKRKIGAVELAESYFSKIEKYDKKINSFITICKDEAINQARLAQDELFKGNAGILCGIPLSVKDNISTKGIRTTCASRMLSDFVPLYDATVVSRLKEAFAVILGKTNMDEFAMGSDSQSSYFGGVHNPHNAEIIPGGSSGGSAAAVAAGFCKASLGSDTGGSVRQPAAFCGITGFRPTYGSVSRYGLIAFASSLDQIGVCAESAEDAAVITDCIRGHDPKDSTTVKRNLIPNTSLIGCSLKGKTIGIIKELMSEDINPQILTYVQKAIDFYKASGCNIKEVSMPSVNYAVSAYYLLSSAEAASNLSRYDGIKYGLRFDGESYDDLVTKTRSVCFGNEVKRRIMLGNYALSSGYYDDYYINALKIKKQIQAEYNEIFSYCDVILSPTTPDIPYKIGEAQKQNTKKYLSDICTVTASLAGIPSISTPCGYTTENLPIGLSISAQAYNDPLAVSFCDAFEKSFTKKEVCL